MKKLFALFLTLVLVLAISACDNKGGEVNNQNDNAVSKTQSQAEQSGGTQESANKQSQDSQPAESATEQGNTQNSQSASTAESTASDTTQSAIGRDRAIELALNHAGLNKADVRDLEAELDRERGGTYWEVDFEHGGYDYSYDINAQTGEIVIAEKEKD